LDAKLARHIIRDLGIYSLTKDAMDELFELDKDSAEIVDLLTQRVKEYEKLRAICKVVMSSK